MHQGSDNNSDVESMEVGDGDGLRMRSQRTDDAKRQEIRNKYRNLIADTERNAEQLVAPESEALTERLEEANKLFKHVKEAREAALDAKFLHVCASLGRQKAQELHTDTVTYQPAEYAEKLVTFLNGRRIGCEENPRISDDTWITVGKECACIFKSAPSFHYMLGSFERGPLEARVRKTKKKETKDDNAKAVQPKNVTSMRKSDQETTTEEVERIYAILKQLYERNKRKPIDYFEFVVDPTSFGHTVENMFHVSFLIKDNAARIYLDDDELPVIEPVEMEESNQSQSASSKKKNQVVVSVSMNEWREIIEAYQITSPAIPPHKK